MASSIYIYPDFKEYVRFYGREQDDITFEAILIDLYVDTIKQKLFVITNTSNDKERILNNRTITHIRNESFKDEHLNEDCRLVTDKDILYKNGYIELFPRFLRKPLMKLRVDRCVGGNIKKTRLDLARMKYDYTRDRINLIVYEPTS
jgi:hypothetical protein|tara:strand:+ start:1030 stop:1470 length:441 start_codon:yes stop_codon:yes gene_type:complete